MHYSNILLATLLALPLSYAQKQAPDGLIVPFKSALPACASLCGPLYDVQGKCTPPNIATTDISCFCSDNRLRAIGGDGTTGVASVCGATACPNPSDMATIRDWYKNFCVTKLTGTTTAVGGAGSTSKSTSTSNASSGNKDTSWFATHTKWVIMIIVVTLGIIVVWVGAWLLRKRYLRKKEKEIEMRPPISGGPHQMQAATGGYTYGDGILDGRGGRNPGAGGHHKEASQVLATPANGSRLKKQRSGWFRSSKE